MADNRRLIGYGIVLNVLLLLTVRDLLVKTAKPSDEEEPEATKPLPPLKMMKKASSGPVVKFLFCALIHMLCRNWYRNVFEQYRTALGERFPDLQFEGSNYNPDMWRVLLASSLSYVKIAVIGLVASGYNPFPLLGMPTPGFYEWAVSNKIYACLMSWFLTGMVENQLMSTGAFEIYYNDLPVWSKLKNGRLPEFQEVLSTISQQHKKVF
ncbi:putative Selenoprotein T [Hypsibius exemplaris]|uniref:Selenoprotein T n=1 Tax=Hypsibius exemplaris TaxID=2072580 RepID=A0A1W0X0V5_HYPEX|nr:putative Selenoprotein T [Hypsibius exemplaris]